MPMYDYRCKACGYEFTETHSINESAFDCPECESEDLQRLITSAPTFARGILTHAGDGYRASKEELQAKWREETPKLQKKIRDKLGPEAANLIQSVDGDD
ncbi:MAG: zinc ribbon domain-containing protein [Chloroflexota bacterium]